MERLKIEDVPTWLLSGKPVVRLWAKDFTQSVSDYKDWLHSLAETLNLKLSVKTIPDPPGVVVQAYVSGDDPRLVDPMIKVGKTTTPWLFCVTKSCRNRVTSPGLPCEAHR